MPSSLRSKIHSGSLNRSRVKTAFMTSERCGAGAAVTTVRSRESSESRTPPTADELTRRVRAGYQPHD
jgi:hypothetical protein